MGLEEQKDESNPTRNKKGKINVCLAVEGVPHCDRITSIDSWRRGKMAVNG